MSDTITTKTLSSIYVINKHAKLYAEKADRAYPQNKKLASVCSNKKDALYTTKSKILQQIQGYEDKIEKHYINGSEYYCFFFTDSSGVTWSFHQPTSEYPKPDKIVNEKTLHSFEKTSEVKRTNLSEKQALRYLQKKYNISPNSYIESSLPTNTRENPEFIF